MRLLFWLLHRLNRPWQRRLGLFFGALLFHVVPIRRRLADQQLAFCFPDWSASKRRAVLKQAYQHLCLTVAEGGLMAELARGGPLEALPPWFSHTGFEHFEAAGRANKGTIVITAHLGNWDLFGVIYALLGVKLNIVARDISNKAANKRWIALRESSGLKQISAHRRQGSLKQILTALRNNEVVALVLDQNMSREKGVFVDFFGQQACTLDLAAVLAKRTGAPVIAAFMIRQPDGSHHAVIHPPISFEPGPDDVTVATQRYTKLIEDQVRAHPEQWLWLHRRWKTRPE